LGYVGREASWAWPELSLNPQETYIALLKASRGFDDPKLRASVAAYSLEYPAVRESLMSPSVAVREH